MRRLPVYFLIDVSESMVGDPIDQVQEGIANIIRELRTDPYALETVFVSIIAFAGKTEKISNFVELYNYYPPKLPIGGGTGLGNAIDFLMNDMDVSLKKTTLEEKGDWKPIIFLFTDGRPTDKVDVAFDKWNLKYRNKSNLVAISIGDNTDTKVLGRITDNVLQLNKTDNESFKKFFKWVTASIKTTSISVSATNDDGLNLAPLTNGYLEKIDLIGLFFGVSYENTIIENLYNNNPHISFIRAHNMFGLFYLLALMYLIISKIFYIIISKNFINLLILLIIFNILLRAVTEPILFPTLFDFLFLYILFLSSKKIIRS